PVLPLVFEDEGVGEGVGVDGVAIGRPGHPAVTAAGRTGSVSSLPVDHREQRIRCSRAGPGTSNARRPPVPKVQSPQPCPDGFGPPSGRETSFMMRTKWADSSAFAG